MLNNVFKFESTFRIPAAGPHQNEGETPCPPPHLRGGGGAWDSAQMWVSEGAVVADWFKIMYSHTRGSGFESTCIAVAARQASNLFTYTLAGGQGDIKFNKPNSHSKRRRMGMASQMLNKGEKLGLSPIIVCRVKNWVYLSINSVFRPITEFFDRNSSFRLKNLVYREKLCLSVRKTIFFPKTPVFHSKN